jgi:Tfp pilus assembly protein PilF
VDEALAMFEKNVKDHPASWNAHDSLAEAYGIKDERQKALEHYTKAMNLTAVDLQKTRIAAVIEQLKKQ